MWPRIGTVGRAFVNDNGPSGPLKCEEFLVLPAVTGIRTYSTVQSPS